MSLINGDMGSDSIVSESKLNDCVCRLLVCGNGTGTFFRETSILDRNASSESNDVVSEGGSLICSTTVSVDTVGVGSDFCSGVSTPHIGSESCTVEGIGVAVVFSVSPEGRHSFRGGWLHSEAAGELPEVNVSAL